MDFDRFSVSVDDDLARVSVVLRRVGPRQEFPFRVGTMRRSGRFGFGHLDRDWL